MHFVCSPQVTGTLGHRDTRSPVHWDTGTRVGVVRPTYRNRVYNWGFVCDLLTIGVLVMFRQCSLIFHLAFRRINISSSKNYLKHPHGREEYGIEAFVRKSSLNINYHCFIKLELVVLPTVADIIVLDQSYYSVLLGGVSLILGTVHILRNHIRGGGTVGSDVTLRQNWSVFIRCRTMPVGAALAL